MESKLKQLLKTIKLNESMLSMAFGVVTVVLIGVLVMRMYGANKPSLTPESDKTAVTTEKVGEVAVETKDDGKKYPTELPSTYKVEKGDHLWAIATKLYGSGYNWVDIAKENNLRNAGQISAGQELKLPKVAVKTVSQPKLVVKEPTNKIEGDTYTVAKGDTLWKISIRAYADGYKWSSVAKFNQLKTPNHLLVGQVVKLPR